MALSPHCRGLVIRCKCTGWIKEVSSDALRSLHTKTPFRDHTVVIAALLHLRTGLSETNSEERALVQSNLGLEEENNDGKLKPRVDSVQTPIDAMILQAQHSYVCMTSG